MRRLTAARFGPDWRKKYRKQLRGYAAFRMPKNPEVMLCTKLPWLLAISCVAALLGVRSDRTVPWWALCIVPLFALICLIAAYFRERDRGIPGLYRYSAAFFALVAVSLTELAVMASLYVRHPAAMLLALFASMLTAAIFLHRVRWQIERGAFSEHQGESASVLPFLAAALGYGTHLLFKRFFSEQNEWVLVAPVLGLLIGSMLSGAVMLWLKSVGAETQD